MAQHVPGLLAARKRTGLSDYWVVGPGQTETTEITESCNRKFGETITKNYGWSPTSDNRLDFTLSRCPPSCQSTSTKLCKSLFCSGMCHDQPYYPGFYGGQLSCNRILTVEWVISSHLNKYCNYQPNCTIEGRVMKLSIKGHATVSKPASPRRQADQSLFSSS